MIADCGLVHLLTGVPFDVIYQLSIEERNHLVSKRNAAVSAARQQANLSRALKSR